MNQKTDSIIEGAEPMMAPIKIDPAKIPKDGLWIATPMLRLFADKKNSNIQIQQLWMDQANGLHQWRYLPVVEDPDAP